MTDERHFDVRTLRTRAVNMRKVLDWLESSQVTEVTATDIDALVAEPPFDGPGRTLAARFVERGILKRLAPGRYAVIRPNQVVRGPLTPGEKLDHWLGEGRYALAFATAMSIHGFGPPIEAGHTLQLLKTRPVTAVPAGLDVPIELHHHLPALKKAVHVDHPLLGQVAVQSEIQTALDAATRPDLCGGVPNVIAFLTFMLQRHPATTLVDAVKPNAQRVTVCRLGFMLERAGAPASVLSPLHDRSGGKYLDLDPGLMRGGPLESTWRLRLNVELQP